jgi:hypothetical protein
VGVGNTDAILAIGDLKHGKGVVPVKGRLPRFPHGDGTSEEGLGLR